MILSISKIVEGELKTAKIRLDSSFADSLPSNKPTELKLKDGVITVRPYYRKVMNGELTIYAEEVL